MQFILWGMVISIISWALYIINKDIKLLLSVEDRV